jgi:excisionase family DNA binding protein
MQVSELPLLLTAKHVQQLLGIGKVTAYTLLKEPGCPVVHFGKSIRLPRDQFMAWLERKASPPPEPTPAPESIPYPGQEWDDYWNVTPEMVYG